MSSYFSTLEVKDEIQVQRVFLLTTIYKKGKHMEIICNEVCRLWLNDKGKTAFTSLRRTLGYYQDSFDWTSSIELRKETDVHWIISDT